MRSIGVNNPKDRMELRDKPMMVKLAVKPADGQYGASNDIKEYAATGGATASPAPAAAAAPGGTATPPWKR